MERKVHQRLCNKPGFPKVWRSSQNAYRCPKHSMIWVNRTMWHQTIILSLKVSFPCYLHGLGEAIRNNYCLVCTFDIRDPVRLEALMHLQAESTKLVIESAGAQDITIHHVSYDTGNNITPNAQVYCMHSIVKAAQQMPSLHGNPRRNVPGCVPVIWVCQVGQVSWAIFFEILVVQCSVTVCCWSLGHAPFA